MRVSTWVVSFLAAALLGPLATSAQSRSVELSCVNKAGENMYRAADGSVVWTASCGHASVCADAVVVLGTTPSSGTIRWYGGGSCHVVNAALKSRPPAGGGTSGGGRKPRNRRRT